MKEVFDLEGTLVNLEPQHQIAFERVAGSLGVKFGEKEFLKFVGAGDEAISKEIASMVGRDHELIRSMKTKIYEDLIENISPRDGVVEYLQQAEGELIIASLTPKHMAHRILEESGLSAFFSHVLTEEDVVNKKPHPELYLKASYYLGVEPEDMLVYEDSPVGVQAAVAAGSHVIAFPVHDVEFDPQPNAIYLSWRDYDRSKITE